MDVNKNLNKIKQEIDEWAKIKTLIGVILKVKKIWMKFMK